MQSITAALKALLPTAQADDESPSERVEVRSPAAGLEDIESSAENGKPWRQQNRLLSSMPSSDNGKPFRGTVEERERYLKDIGTPIEGIDDPIRGVRDLFARAEAEAESSANATTASSKATARAVAHLHVPIPGSESSYLFTDGIDGKSFELPAAALEDNHTFGEVLNQHFADCKQLEVSFYCIHCVPRQFIANPDVERCIAMLAQIAYTWYISFEIAGPEDWRIPQELLLHGRKDIWRHIVSELQMRASELHGEGGTVRIMDAPGDGFEAVSLDFEPGGRVLVGY